MTDFTNFLIDNADNITLVLILSSISIFIFVGIAYYYANMKKREVIQTILSMFGNFILILNILFIIYGKFLDRLNQKVSNIKDLNKLTLDSLRNIFITFYKDPKNLGSLYSEIFEKKYDTKPKLTYEENNFLFTIFQTIETVYRMYYISGKDTLKLSTDQYEGWDNFILAVCGSPKSQLFYKKNHHLFSSLGFEKYISRYFNEVELYVKDLPLSK